MSEMPIGLQLYTVRSRCREDLADALSRVAEMGYDAAEPWGYDGASLAWLGVPASRVRDLFDAAGLRCCGCHIRPEALEEPNRRRTMDFAETLGSPLVVVAGNKGAMDSTEGIAGFARLLNEAAEALAARDLRTGYHAHASDFAAVDGTCAWDRLFEQTRSEVVMQLDTGNCLAGGGDPAAVLRKFPGRAASIHLKDDNSRPGAVLEEGDVDWADVFAAIRETQQPEWLVIEQGEHVGADEDVFEIPRRSLAAFREMDRGS